MTFLWDIDGPVLAAIVQQAEVEGRDMVDLREIFQALELDRSTGMRSVTGYVPSALEFILGG